MFIVAGLAKGCHRHWYVHVAAHPARVVAGERATAGQAVCAWGNVGFCPEPHLHVELHLDRAQRAPSAPFNLRRTDGPPRSSV